MTGDAGGSGSLLTRPAQPVGLPVRWQGIDLRLLPCGAVLLLDSATLLVADPHFGKAAGMRATGLALPVGSTQATVDRLDAAVSVAAARRVIVLGDFLHAPASRQPHVIAALSEWRSRHADIDLVLVRGNHDRRAGDPPASLGIACLSPPVACEGLWLCHEPDEAQARGPAVAGHLHPAVRLRDRARRAMRCPCFWMRPGLLVLPAFGAFTGTFVVEPTGEDRVFVINGEAVVEPRIRDVKAVTGPRPRARRAR